MKRNLPVGISRSSQLLKSLKDAYFFKKSTQGDFDRASLQAEAYLAKTLGRLKGLPQKIGQILSLSHSVEENHPFMELAESAENSLLTWDDIQKELEEEYSEGEYEQVFQSFEKEPFASASLSQVHRAVLKQEQDTVAVKILYPKIKEAILQDLKILGWLGLPFGAMKKGFHLKEFQELFLETMLKEVDYSYEIQNYKLYSQVLNFCPYLRIPKVYEKYSSDKILVMSFLQGENFHDVCTYWNQQDKTELAKKIVHLFFNSLLRGKVLHADPHPGNYRFINENRKIEILLYDFGCVKTYEEEKIQAWIRIFASQILNFEIDFLHELNVLGFDVDALSLIKDKLPLIFKVLLEPFVSDDYNLSKWNRTERINAILGEDKWLLRTSAPAEILFVMRSFQGMFYYLNHLKVKMPMRSWLTPLIRDLVEINHNGFLNNCDTMAEDSSKLAKRLCIQVWEDGITKVKLTLKPHLALEITDLIPNDVKQNLGNKIINIQNIENRLKLEDALKAQELFILNDKNKKIKMWLE